MVPNPPTSASFIGENVDLVLFPEGYVAVSDHERTEAVNGLASDLGATLLVGGIERRADYGGRTCQVLLRFDPDGFHSRVYTKHSAAKAVAFERPDWEPNDMLPTIELGNVTAGATICHDHYLGLLPRFLAGLGALLRFNPSFDNVREIKWSSVLRLRAVENRFYALCTLHCDMKEQRTHPFAFAPDGTELSARQAGSKIARPLSECCEARNIYVVDLDLAAAGEPLGWSKLPPAKTPKRTRSGKPRRLTRVALRGGRPTIYGCSRIDRLDSGFRGETVHGPVYAGMVPGAQILDACECFRVIDQARQMNCTPIIWNHWERLPTGPERLATIRLGRVIECCAPIVISDECGIHELIELSNRNKIPVRRVIEPSGDACIDLGYAWGLDNAFKMVTKHVPAHMRAIVLDRYRSLSLSRT